MAITVDIPEHAVSRVEQRVRFADTDLMGIVHHASYLMYFEAGRVEYLRRRGALYTEWVEQGINLPVIEVGLKYRRPARFDDLLIIETRVGRLTRATVRFDYRIEREGELLTEGFTSLASTDAGGRPRRVAPWVLEVVCQPDQGQNP